MYYLIAILTTTVLPLASVAAESVARPDAGLIDPIGKWFVFWGVGIRLLLAGLTQAIRPSFTAGILGIKDPAGEKIVSELGYANVAIGATAVLSLLWPNWAPAAGLAGGVFLGAAGLKHATNADRNAKENVAMATDLFVAAMIAIYLVALIS